MNYSKLERNIATEKQFLKSQTCPPSLLFLFCTYYETGFRTDLKKSLATKSTRHYFIFQDTLNRNQATSADYVQSLWTITKKIYNMLGK